MICTNCQSQYGQTVNVRDGGKAEWQCRDCKAVQPWVDEVRTGGLRPAKLADLGKRPAWIEAAARSCAARILAEGVNTESIYERQRRLFADIIEEYWRRAQ